MAVTSESIKHGLEIGCKNRSYKCLQILYEWYLCVSSYENDDDDDDDDDVKLWNNVWQIQCRWHDDDDDDDDDDDYDYDDDNYDDDDDGDEHL